MNHFRYFFILVAALSFSSCEDSFDGTLSLKQQIALNLKKGALTLVPGEYQTEVAASSSKVKLKITINGQEQKVEFKLNKDVKVKTFNDLDLAPAVSGQPYRLLGHERTDFSQSDSVRSNESCTYSTIENRCGYERGPQRCSTQTTCADQNNPATCSSVKTCVDGDMQYICRNVSVSHYGNQEVEYHMSYWKTYRNVMVLDPATNALLGDFNNDTLKSSKNYTYKETCH